MSEDLYDDLPETAEKKTGPSSTQLLSKKRRLNESSTSVAADEKPRSLVEEVSYLQERVQLLEKENKLLKHNMGTLYRTAVSEIQRKESQISNLQLELDKAHAAKWDCRNVSFP